MSNDKNESTPNDVGRNRRGSVTSAAFSNLFQRSNSTTTGTNNIPGGSMTSAMARDQRRRLSVTTLGLSGTGPQSATTPFGSLRRGSISTNNSDSIDENAVDDDDTPRTAPVTPFTRRMSFGAQAMRSVRQGGASPGSSTGRPDPARRSSGGNSRAPTSTSTAARRTSSSQASTALPTRTPSDMLSAARSDQGFNWSEQLRSRAESTVSGVRPGPGFGAVAAGSPPRPGNGQHDRAQSISDMPAPPQQAAAMKPKQPERPKPDHMQERILKGDFYMD